MSIPLLPLLIVVASSLCWGGVDLLRKLLVRDIATVPLLFLLTIGAAPFFAVWMVAEGVAAPEPGYWTPALLSMVLNIAANLLFLQGMRVAPLSITVPLLSLTPAFATMMAIPMLGEHPSAKGSIGILMVIAGAIWLHWQPREGTHQPGALKGALMVAATALFWAMTTPLDKIAMERAPAAFHGFVLTAGVAVAVFGVLVAQGRLKEIGQVRSVPVLMILALIVSAAALGLQLFVLPQVYVGTIETLKRGIGNFMALLSGKIFFNETVTARKLLAIVLMAAGVALILT